MKKYIFIALSLIWFGCVGLHLYMNTNDVKEDLEYTVFNDATFVGDDVYITENTGESGYLYCIGSDYHVKNVFRADEVVKDTFVEQVIYSENKIYLLIMAETEEDGQKVGVYNVLRLDPDTLVADGCTKWVKTYVPGTISDFSTDGEYLYITMLMEERTQAGIYAIPLSSFSAIEELDELNIRNVSTIRYSDFTTATDGYYFEYALFSGGTMTTIENGNGLLSTTCYNDKAAEYYDAKIISWKQFVHINKSLVVQNIMLFIAGELLIASILLFFYRRNRVGYLIFIWEVMLCVVISLGAYFLKQITYSQNLNQGVKFATYVMSSLRTELADIEAVYENTDEFYNSQKYRDLYQSLEALNRSYDKGSAFENIVVVDTSTDVIVAAAEGYDRCSFKKIYGNTPDIYVCATSEFGVMMTCDTYLDGKETYFVCMGDEDETHPNMVLVGVFDVKDIYAQVDNEKLLKIGVLVLFVVTSLLGIMVLLFQSFDLHRMGDSMEAVAGERRIKKPRYLGADVGDMWSGLLDIDRSFKNINYKKYKLYEAYYRFAPKAVATLLGKDSVSEVNNGDSVKSSGTVASYRVDIKKILRNADNESIIRGAISNGNICQIMELVNRYQEQGLALQVSSDSDMSDMKFIMPENNRKAIDFGVEFHKELQRNGLTDDEKVATIFMHYSNFIYGVAGTEEHAMQVMIAPDYMKLEDYLDVLTELKLRLVVTGVVFDRENEVPANRLIGYFDVEGSEPIALYEILEACPDEERHLKQDCDETFQKALKLFLENDFYLARNNFAHILKQNPQDTVARWYVFACEKYHEIGTSNMSIGLNQELDF